MTTFGSRLLMSSTVSVISALWWMEFTTGRCSSHKFTVHCIVQWFEILVTLASEGNYELPIDRYLAIRPVVLTLTLLPLPTVLLMCFSLSNVLFGNILSKDVHRY